ncbi:hypothetical protein GCM10028857_04590 [Salinarchaeum chitinilyticum]
MSRDDSSAGGAEDGAAEAGNGDDPDRTGRPLIAGAIGLLAGIVGGIAATTIAPGNLFLTILLIVVVVLVVTVGTLQVLAR